VLDPKRATKVFACRLAHLAQPGKVVIEPMPPHRWATSQADAMNMIVPRDMQAAHFVWWAGNATNSLHYLADVAATVAPADEPYPLGHGWQVAALAHARWATGTAVTAIDLCAATLGRLHTSDYPKPSRHEMDFRDARKHSNLKNLPRAVTWMDAVDDDSNYQLVLDARHALTHQQLRTTHGGTVGPSGVTTYRTLLDLRRTGKTVGTDDLLRASIDAATRHVEAFYAAIISRSI
jgi:hypothetical protein